MNRQSLLLRTALLWLGATVAAAPEPAAQTPADSAFGGEIAITVVNVDVMVRDHDGRPITGLEVANFRVLQDGVEMPISNFAEFSRSPGTERSGESAVGLGGSPGSRRERPPIFVVLYIDSANLHPLQRNRVLERVEMFVRQHLTPPVQMMVVTTWPTLEVLVPFTENPDLLVAALEKAATASGARFLRDVEQRLILERLHEISSDRRAPLLEFTQQPDVIIAKAQLQGQITSWINEVTFATRDALAEMREAVRLFSGLEGRKVLLHISNGLPMTPGIGLLEEFSSVFRDPSVFSRLPQTSLADDVRALSLAANRAGVSLYTIDSTGLAPLPGFQAADRFAPGAMAASSDLDDVRTPLRYLAGTTGGVAVVDTNDPTAGLAKLADDLASWYSIGYTVEDPGSNVAHRVEVELPDHPAATVRTRQWFVAAPPETRLVDVVVGQLLHHIESNPMDLRLDLGRPVLGEGAQLILPVRLSVPLHHLALREEASFLVARLEVCVAVRDDQGRSSPPRLQAVEVRVPPGAHDRGVEQRYDLELRLAVRDREHVVAAGILDRGSGLISSARGRTPPR